MSASKRSNSRSFDLFGASYYEVLSALGLSPGITNWNSTIRRNLPWRSVEASEYGFSSDFLTI